MIQTIACTETERIWSGKLSRKLPADIQQRALAKLSMIDAAETLDDLKLPPSNRLHELKDDRAGQHSISINMKWRICFRWNNGNAYDVEIVDYH
jgi:proteic killer suppression protein